MRWGWKVDNTNFSIPFVGQKWENRRYIPFYNWLRRLIFLYIIQPTFSTDWLETNIFFHFSPSAPPPFGYNWILTQGQLHLKISNPLLNYAYRPLTEFSRYQADQMIFNFREKIKNKKELFSYIDLIHLPCIRNRTNDENFVRENFFSILSNVCSPQVKVSLGFYIFSAHFFWISSHICSTFVVHQHYSELAFSASFRHLDKNTFRLCLWWGNILVSDWLDWFGLLPETNNSNRCTLLVLTDYSGEFLNF